MSGSSPTTAGAGRRFLSTLAVALSFSSPLAAFADKPLTSSGSSAAGTRVNSDPESLLRYGLPINSKEVRDIQGSVESAKSNLKTRRLNFAKGDVNNAKTQLVSNKDKLFKQIPASRKEAAEATYAKMLADIPPLEAALNEETSSGSGSLQERAALDKANALQSVLSRDLSTFEELMVPESFKREIPAEYAGLPALQGRAEVSMILTRPDGTKFNVDGKNYDEVKLKMVIDGYNAPLTGGNFVDLVNKGWYDKKPITRADGFVTQMGDPDKENEAGIHGYVPTGSTKVRNIPLEVSLKGDKELLYGITSEDDGRGYAAAVLPFQAYGALGMAREEYEADSASSQFFWLLFESDLTPAGKNLLDGRYSCFGYTVEGADLLKAVKEGDVVASAKVTNGLENLKTR